jgi:FKBP-type peptidyl-prolyl cis-trans isomerase FkpA
MRPAPRLHALLAIAVWIGVSACGSSSPTAPDQSNIPYSQVDLTVGTGTEATTGTTASVNYGGWLYSDTAADHKGQQFDANSLAFVVGAGTLGVKGFDTGVTGMKVGGVRRIIVPPSLAYGATGNGPIPPNAALVFDIQLANVQ